MCIAVTLARACSGSSLSVQKQLPRPYRPYRRRRLKAWVREQINLEKNFPEVYRYAMDLMERENHPFRGHPALEEKRKARAKA